MEFNRPAAASALALLTWAGSASVAAREAACPNDKQVAELRSSDFIKAVGSALSGSHCSAIVKVLTQLHSTKKPGGRKLHEGKPLDRASAQAELQKARSDPEFAGRLAAASEGLTDPIGRLVVEAALLDDDGYFAARQLLMEEILKTPEAR